MICQGYFLLKILFKFNFLLDDSMQCGYYTTSNTMYLDDVFVM